MPAKTSRTALSAAVLSALALPLLLAPNAGAVAGDPADFTGHGNRDLLALDKDGTLWAYPGTGKLNGMQTLGNRIRMGLN
ncbi:hypothetical protein [Streptomyces violascens]|uniref:hypothetical protein n=1 Tax=Streptomyces violascens TaxID=67381 RepID=UPI0016751884|nr:hypothetical protein [Streptomyces violascens]GGU51732.1 hypothetical protein GCM10010289_85140 [Streptomyces violascens]